MASELQAAGGVAAVRIVLATRRIAEDGGFPRLLNSGAYAVFHSESRVGCFGERGR